MATASSSTTVPQAAGGVVEPSSRAAIAKERFQTPKEPPGERYELRDPFADVTYRTDKLTEVIAKADQLGSRRFTAIAADGSRTVVEKDGEQWTRGTQLQPAPQRPLDFAPDEPQRATEGTNGRAPMAVAPPAQADVRAVEKVDAEAERAALVERLEAALKERYVIKRAPVVVGDVSIGHTEYRFRGDTSRVAFTESTFRLATDTNSPSVARSMVDVAQARNWKGLRISGSEDFRRMVWLEASARGVQAVGYEPNPADLDVLKREREARQANRIEPARDTAGATGTDKPAARGSGGRKAVVAAIEAVLVAQRVPEAKRAAVLAAANQKLAERARDGKTPKVKLYDHAAAPQRTTKAPTPEVTRTREPAAPAHAR